MISGTLGRGATTATIFVILSLVLAMIKYASSPELTWRFHSSYFDFSVPQDEPKFQQVFDYKRPEGNAHSPSLVRRLDGFSVIWFDGSREASNDITIQQVQISKDEDQWVAGDVTLLFSRFDLMEFSRPRQTILTIGNVIAERDQGLSFFATIVSFGGWAAASIAHVVTDEGAIERVEKLPLSPFLNRSHLVRAPAIRYVDGSLGIPAYLELGRGIGDFARLDAQRRVRAKARINQKIEAIQATIVPYGPQEAVALSRSFDDRSDRLVVNWTRDAGRSWTPDTLINDIPNPNSPVAALLLSDGSLLMAFNDSPKDSSILKLALSQDQGRTWRRIYTLESNQGAARYPALLRLPGGDLALTYSIQNKRGVRAFVFNEAWIQTL